MIKLACATAILIITSVTTGRAQFDLEVTISNIRDTTGVVMIGLFNSQKSFLKKPLYGTLVDADSGEVSFVFEGIEPGEYAISVFHDANSNNKLDTKFMGLPKEGFGFSNNVMGTLGPPTFEKAKFKVGDDTAITINLRYM